MATEKRLIDANAVIKDIDNYYNNSPFSHPGTTWLRGLELTVGLLLKAPTVDAVPVVQGWWEDEYGGKYQNKRYRCSVCKEKALYKNKQDILDNWVQEQELTPICPYCGAILRKKVITI
jgi:hypothetical protein